MKIYKVEYRTYETETEEELAMDNIAIYDGKLKAWEYLDVKDDSALLICVESDSELPQTPDYEIAGLGYFERTSDNVYKSIFDIDSIERLADDNTFTFENVKAYKKGGKWIFEEF